MKLKKNRMSCQHDIGHWTFKSGKKRMSCWRDIGHWTFKNKNLKKFECRVGVTLNNDPVKKGPQWSFF